LVADPLQFWDLLSMAMNENPPTPDQVPALLPMFKGLELGKAWDRSRVPSAILKATRQAAESIAPMLSKLPVGSIANHAFLPPATIGNCGTDRTTRAVIGRVGLTANRPYEAIYWFHTLDSQGQPLSGRHKYTMTFKRGIPFEPPGFWSITLQSDNPGPDKESNRLPSPSSGSFYLIPRAYAPTQEAVAILSKPEAWPVPAVVRVN
jgi:DNA sulfur modification protein DndE